MTGPGARPARPRHPRRGLEQRDPSYFVTERQRARLQQAGMDFTRGTVGAVCLDAAGHLAAGTSTGGRRGQAPGRIGDTPVIGAGTWADHGVAVSCTGDGEEFIRAGAARQLALLHQSGLTLQEAADRALRDVGDLGGRGSVTFPAGSVSGTSLSFDVHTLAAGAPSEAKTINIALSSSDTATDASSSPPSVIIDAHGLPYLNPSLPISQRVNDLLSRMSLAEKIGQMTQADRFMFTDAATTSNSSANDLRAWLVGSLLSGGGDTPTPNTPTGWADMVDGFQTQALATPLQIPLIYGEDTVHGDGNMMGATIFPHNVGMGATRDPALALAEGQVTAAETRATGPEWGFAPCLCVARDVRWGRTYESFGEDPALVSRMRARRR